MKLLFLIIVLIATLSSFAQASDPLIDGFSCMSNRYLPHSPPEVSQLVKVFPAVGPASVLILDSGRKLVDGFSSSDSANCKQTGTITSTSVKLTHSCFNEPMLFPYENFLTFAKADDGTMEGRFLGSHGQILYLWSCK